MIRDERYGEADTFLKQAQSRELTGYEKRDFLHLKMVTEAYHGRYSEAWETLQNYYEFQESEGSNPEEVRASYSTFEEDLIDQINEPEQDKSEEIKNSTEEFSLIAYPNPFNPSTNINFTLPSRTEVSLKVFDMLGREVAELVRGNLEAGTHSAVFNASHLASGMYIYRLQAGQVLITKEMMLIK